MHSNLIDEFDVRLLRALQANAKLTHQELSEHVHLSASQCQRRIKRLEELGLITGYATLLNRDMAGLNILAIMHVSIEKQGRFPAQEFHEMMRQSPVVLECYSTMGDYDYFLKVVATDLASLNTFMMERLLNSPLVRRLRSNILLQEIKATHVLPIQKG